MMRYHLENFHILESINRKTQTFDIQQWTYG